MKKAFMISILTLFLLVMTGNVFCEEMAKEGTDSGTGFAHGTWNSFPLEKGTAFMTWESKGVSLSDSGEGPFHNMSINCAGINLWVKGVKTVMGYCTEIAPDGDKILYQLLQNGKYKYIGGTGKFAGIEGGGEYTSYSVKPAAEGTFQNVDKYKSSYKLP